MPATSTTPAPLEGRCLSRRDCEIHCITAVAPTQNMRWHLDRSDQINQNSRAFLVPPRGAGQTGQKSISLRCRKIRISWPPKRQKIQTCLLSLRRMCSVRGSINRLVPVKEWWSLTGSNRRHPACKAGALPAELRPHFLPFSSSHPGRTERGPRQSLGARRRIRLRHSGGFSRVMTEPVRSVRQT